MLYHITFCESLLLLCKIDDAIRFLLQQMEYFYLEISIYQKYYRFS